MGDAVERSYIILLWSMFFSSIWFYTCQFNDVSLAQFDTRTRALSSTLYRSAQIIGTMVFGFALDFHKLRRTIRAKLAWAALLVLTMAISNGGYTFQTEYTSAEATQIDYVKMDWTDGSSYIDRMSYTFLMAFSMPPGKRMYTGSWVP